LYDDLFSLGFVQNIGQGFLDDAEQHHIDHGGHVSSIGSDAEIDRDTGVCLPFMCQVISRGGEAQVTRDGGPKVG